MIRFKCKKALGIAIFVIAQLFVMLSLHHSHVPSHYHSKKQIEASRLSSRSNISIIEDVFDLQTIPERIIPTPPIALLSAFFRICTEVTLKASQLNYAQANSTIDSSTVPIYILYRHLKGL
ncbi:hypothetical protein [Flavobacterium sp. '19STA2R22 D10 B1']|uniref:hypothetical protein n=1 Tax=Flavobacterium aerium TaxID=3037261 RepID=UPI00278C0C56|nr:hypothetical protein [Flavobacterium sp. '19STA2R22 D10 B1']